ncbi:hypothetical protein [Sphaerotilus sulfidivorans]|nr:hypothetical protein CQA4T8M7_26340 [Sphaerotilus natans]
MRLVVACMLSALARELLTSGQLAGDRSADLGDRGERFLGGARGFLGAAGDLVGRALELFGSGGRLVDAGRQLARCAGHPLGDLLLLGQRACALAAGLGVAGHRAGHAACDDRCGHGFMNGLSMLGHQRHGRAPNVLD